MGLFSCSNNLLQRSIGASVSNIFPNGPRLQPGFLKYHAVASPKASSGNPSDIAAVHPYSAAVYIIKPHKKVNYCSLSASGRTHKGDSLPRLYRKIQILDQAGIRHVREIHMLQRYLAPHILKHRSIRIICRDRRLIHQRKHPGRRSKGILQLRHNTGNLIKRLGILIGII